MTGDIIRDIMDRIADRLGLPEELRDQLGMVECDIRHDWGGERPYIAKQGESAQRETSARNRAIIRDWRAGERVSYLSRKYGISRQRVWQIING
jgi:Mor family transcriptional regulator